MVGGLLIACSIGRMRPGGSRLLPLRYFCCRSFELPGPRGGAGSPGPKAQPRYRPDRSTGIGVPQHAILSSFPFLARKRALHRTTHSRPTRPIMPPAVGPSRAALMIAPPTYGIRPEVASLPLPRSTRQPMDERRCRLAQPIRARSWICAPQTTTGGQVSTESERWIAGK